MAPEPDDNDRRPMPDSKGTPQPDWTSDELTLALDVYFDHEEKLPSKQHNDLLKLREFINLLPINGRPRQPNQFRTVASVSMKLANFAAIDPNHGGAGLSAGGKRDRAIWDEFAHDRDGLRATALAIRSILDSPDNTLDVDHFEEDVVGEGRLLWRRHLARERNSKLVRQKRDAVRDETGRLACEACGLDFSDTYGELGDGFIECHHLVPLAETGPRQTQLKDLAVLCSNCHRMIHRMRPLGSVKDLQRLLAERQVVR